MTVYDEFYPSSHSGVHDILKMLAGSFRCNRSSLKSPLWSVWKHKASGATGGAGYWKAQGVSRNQHLYCSNWYFSSLGLHLELFITSCTSSFRLKLVLYCHQMSYEPGRLFLMNKLLFWQICLCRIYHNRCSGECFSIERHNPSFS